MSSSLLPLNITPATTSIQPPVWWNDWLISDRGGVVVNSRRAADGGRRHQDVTGDRGFRSHRVVRVLHHLSIRAGCLWIPRVESLNLARTPVPRPSRDPCHADLPVREVGPPVAQPAGLLARRRPVL